MKVVWLRQICVFQERLRLLQKQTEETSKRDHDTKHKQMLAMIEKHNHALQQNTSLNTSTATQNKSTLNSSYTISKPAAGNTSFTIQQGQSAVVAAASTNKSPNVDS